MANTYGENAALARMISTALSDLKHWIIDPSRIEFGPAHETIAGGYGDVQKGRFVGSPNLIAVKKLRPTGNKRQRTRVAVALTRELRIWEKLNHPNVLSLFGFYINENMLDQMWLVTLWQDAMILDYIARTSPSIYRRMELAQDTAEGLAYLHRGDPSVCHGDIKPSNTLINNQGRAVICDFGLAKIFEEVPDGLTTTELHSSPRHSAPELLQQGSTRTLASDVWSWGGLLLQIMTDRRPYPDTNDRNITFARAQHYPPDHTDALDLPNFLKHILKRCWAIKPDQRPTIVYCANAFSDCGALSHHIPNSFPNWNTQFPKPSGNDDPRDWAFTLPANPRIPFDVVMVQRLQFLGPRDMCLSASGRYLALSGFLGVSVIAIGHAQPSVSLKRETQTTLICFSQDESRIAAVDINGLVEIWSLRTARRERTFQGPPKHISCLSFSQQDQLLVALLEGDVFVWAVATGMLRCILSDCRAIAVSPYHHLLAGACGGSLAIWDLTSGNLLHRIPTSSETVSFVANGEMIVNRHPSLLDLQQWDVRPVLQNYGPPSNRMIAGPRGTTKSVVLTSDGDLAICLHKRFAYAIWDLSIGLPLAILADNQLDPQRVDNIIVSPHSTRAGGLFAIQQNGTVVLFEYKTEPKVEMDLSP